MYSLRVSPHQRKILCAHLPGAFLILDTAVPCENKQSGAGWWLFVAGLTVFISVKSMSLRWVGHVAERSRLILCQDRVWLTIFIVVSCSRQIPMTVDTKSPRGTADTIVNMSLCCLEFA
jgi:hypothetical protein